MSQRTFSHAESQCRHIMQNMYFHAHQWRIYGGGGGGFRGFKPPLGLPSKNLMCIEKRHHNMSRPTQYVPIALCLRLSLRQQGLNPKGGRGGGPLSWTAFYGLQCVSRCQENITYGDSKQQKKNRLAATRLEQSVIMDCFLWSPLRQQMPGKHHLRGFIAKKSARRYAASGRCSASSLGQTPPWKKARSAPVHSRQLLVRITNVPDRFIHNNL